MWFFLENVVELIPAVAVLGVVGNSGISGDDGVLRSDVEGVVNLPIDIANLSSWMEQPLQWSNSSF